MSEQKPRPAKKSETLEVRLPYETKREFLDACREDGTTASEVVRGSIDRYLEERERPNPSQETGKLLNMITSAVPKPVRKIRYAAGAAGVVALAALVALPSAAGPDLKSMFQRLDANKDGVLSADEFAGPKTDGKADKVFVFHKTEKKDIDARDIDEKEAKAAAKGTPQIKEQAYTFWLGDEEPNAEATHNVVVERREVRVITNDKDGKAAKPDKLVLPEDVQKSEFERFDANKDGKVSYDEFAGRQRTMLEAGFKLLDTNGDKMLSEEEYAKIASPISITLDADGKGDVDTEIEAKWEAKTVNPASAEKIKAQFEKLDKNGDKKLSLTEYLPPT